MKKTTTAIIAFSFLLAIALSSFFAFGGTDNIDATITITSTPPEIDQVWVPSSITPNDYVLNKAYYVAFNVTDVNGANDLDHSTAKVHLHSPGETNISNTTTDCTYGINGSTWIIFNCTIKVPYYMKQGTWSVNVTIQDNSGSTNQVTNNTKTTTVNSLDAIRINENTINFGSVGSGTNDQDTTQDIDVNNTGNNDYTTIQVTSYNLTTGAGGINRDIYASNFCVNDADDANTGCDVMATGSAQTITGATVSRATSAVGSKEILYPFVDVPSGLIAGAYTSTSNWVVTTS